MKKHGLETDVCLISMRSVEVCWMTVRNTDNVAWIAAYIISSSFIKCLNNNNHSDAHVAGGNDFLSMTGSILSYF